MWGLIKRIFSKQKVPICDVKTVIQHLEGGTILFDSKIKQRVVIINVDVRSEYNYTVTMQPVLSFGLKWNAYQPYELHAREMLNRFKVMGRI